MAVAIEHAVSENYATVRDLLFSDSCEAIQIGDCLTK
jgi:hypothetical protein